MNLTIRLLGCEVLHISTDPPVLDSDRGDCLATPIGFTNTTIDLPAREQGRDYE